MFRNKVLTLFAAVFSGGFGFGSYSMLDIGSSGGGIGILTGLFSIPFMLVALAASIATIYLPFNNLRVSIQSGEVTILRRLLFVPIFYKRLAAGSISYLSIKKSGSTGQGVDKIEHLNCWQTTGGESQLRLLKTWTARMCPGISVITSRNDWLLVQVKLFERDLMLFGPGKPC